MKEIVLLIALFSVLASCQDFDYGIIIDAGSSGSRIYLYQWPHRAVNMLPLVSPTTINQTVISKKINTPLSSFDNNVANAGASLSSLVDYVKANLPQAKWAATPIYLKATAGMRALNQSAQDAIIANVRTYLKTSPFLFKDDYAQVIPGTHEGVFGWITTNYATKLLTTTNPATFGALDMGGASTQITFDPEGNPTSNLFNMTLGINIFPLYTYSYALGQDQSLRLLNAGLISDNVVDGNGNILNPCYLQGWNETHPSGKVLLGTGDYTACKAAVRKYIVTSSTSCASTCGIGNVYQPAVTGSFYAFSAFAYTGQFFGLPANASVGLLVQSTTQFCGTNFSVVMANNPTVQLSFLKMYCFGGTYMSEVLRQYGFKDDGHQITTTAAVGDIELTWALGAMIYEANLLPFNNTASLGTTSGSATTATTATTTGKSSDAASIIASIFAVAIMTLVSLLM